MAGLFESMRRRKLYKQWVQNAGLHYEDMPNEVAKELPDAPAQEREWKPPSVGVSSIKMHYVLVIGSIFTIMVIAISILATILVMQSC